MTGEENIIAEWPVSDKAFKALLFLVTITGFVIAAQQLDVQNTQLKTQIELNAPIMGWSHSSCPKIEGNIGNSKLTITNEGNSPLPFEFKISGLGTKIKLTNAGTCSELSTECLYGFGPRQGAYYVSSRGSKEFDYEIQVFGQEPKYSITLTDLFRNASAVIASCDYISTGDGWILKSS